ncbi:arabinose-5-phosphate isomerase [Synechococcus sp. Minos11]|uniref:KpsF/GutQ family sugar-phosphate isomerase n=1 Tax=Synechococcus sp. Minos11 TaxID=221341 RepID=UPI001646E488|nr:KpsF/GutQ family sugar-phosphate isomerase [Synechococcus sp. Minos11]QNJ07787.1 arabinose-5-phosphate isomerase [Synechococcus sp. Minos11]
MNPLAPVLQQEAQALLNTAAQLRPDQAEAALDLLQHCSEQGAKLVVTGVGKSGIVARKIAATFTSIGLMALYLNPLDALHGDLGVVGADDVVLLLSNSGESSELLALLPHLHRRGSACIALTGRLDSSLARGAQVVLDGSVDREVCPLNLAPTASTAVAMAIGDALAAVWMQRQGITQADFAVNHPAGSLGRQLTLSVADLMVPIDRCPPLPPDAALADVVDQLTGALAGAAWVQQPDQPKRLLGLITDGDLRRALRTHSPQAWAAIQAVDLMTTDPITAAPNQLAVAALELMERNRRKSISVLPVQAASGELVGLLRLHDLVQAGLSRASGTTTDIPQAA